MKLPSSLEFLRRTRAWQSVSDARYLQRERARRNFYRQFVPCGALVFDIGANVGHYTLIFASLGARVVALEPQDALATGLRRRFYGRTSVKIIRAAVGAVSSTAVLHKAPGQTEIASLRDDLMARSRFAAEHAFSETETVPVTTLDALVEEHGLPDFCKIDVEGFEPAVLAGLSRQLPVISLEFNREFWSEALKCLERLEALGPYHFNYALGEAASLASPSWVTGSELRATLEKEADPLLWGDLYARIN